MKMIIRSAEVTLACVSQRLSRELAPVVPSAEDQSLRPHAATAPRLIESEALEDSRRVGAYLDAGAYLAQFGGLLENLDIEASTSKGQCGGEAADSRSDYDDSHCIENLERLAGKERHPGIWPLPRRFAAASP